MERVDRSRSLPPVGNLIRHNVGVLVASFGLALGLATLYVVNLPLSYTSDAVVLLSPAPGNPLTAETASSSSLQMTVALETERQLALTPAVFELVSKELGRPVPDSGERIQVSVPSNTQMLQVSFTSTTPERAREGSQALADSYLKYRAERAEAVQQARIDGLKEQIANADGDLRRAVTEAGSSAYASQEVSLFVDRLAGFNNSLSAAELVSTHPGYVTSAPTLPDRANGLPGWLLLLAAAALGLLTGVGLALLREWRRDLIRDADVGTELGVPEFATIHSHGHGELATDAGPEVHESYRQLRTAVIANAPRPYTLAVTVVEGESARESSALSAEVAANLAVVMAEAKLTVLLITTNSLQHPVEELLGVEVAAGLTDVVFRGASACDSLVPTHGISVLTAGPEVDGSSDLTATSSFRSIVDDLRQHFDYIIVAAADAGSSDGEAALLVADSVMLVFTPDTTTRTLLSVTLDRLQYLGVETLGAARVNLSGDFGGRPRPQPARAADNSEADVAGVTH